MFLIEDIATTSLGSTACGDLLIRPGRSEPTLRVRIRDYQMLVDLGADFRAYDLDASATGRCMVLPAKLLFDLERAESWRIDSDPFEPGDLFLGEGGAALAVTTRGGGTHWAFFQGQVQNEVGGFLIRNWRFDVKDEHKRFKLLFEHRPTSPRA